MAALADELERAALDYEEAWTRYNTIVPPPPGSDEKFAEIVLAKAYAHQALLDAARAYRKEVNHDS